MSKKQRTASILFGILIGGMIVYWGLPLVAPRLSRDKSVIRFSAWREDDIHAAIKDLCEQMNLKPGPQAGFKGAPFSVIGMHDDDGQTIYFLVKPNIVIGTVRVNTDTTFPFSEKQVIMELARRIGITDEVEPLPLPETQH
jgi:hypothetical protein